MSEPTARKPDLSALRIERKPVVATTASPPRSGRRATLAVVAMVALLVVAAYATIRVTRRMAPAPQVKTALVVLRAPSETEAVLTASGYVVAQRKAAVASKATGRLVYLGVEEGDHVTEGQLIARVESNDVEAELAHAAAVTAAARASQAEAEAKRVEAKLAYERAKSLNAQQLLSSADLDQAVAARQVAEANVNVADAQVVAAEAAVRAAEVAVESTRIRAPFDGTVLTKSADLGEMVAPMASAPGSRGAVVSIADMASIEVEADVSEAYIQRVRPDTPVEIVLDAYPETKYPGRVKKIVPTADRAKATVMTKVVFDAPDARVLPEMSAKVTFLARSQAPAAQPELVVPRGAVVSRGDASSVWKVEHDEVRRQSVTLGPVRGSQQVISSGLAAGEVVVVDPPADLADGATIRGAAS